MKLEKIKMRFKYIFLTILLLMINSIFSQEKINKTFDANIYIESNKLTYFYDEQIWIKYNVTCSGDNTPRINRGALHESFVIKDQSSRIFGLLLSKNSNLGDPLKLGESIKGKFQVLSLYGEFEDESINVVLPVGVYTIQIEWKEYGFEPLCSNQIEIHVVEPSGDDLKVLNLIKKAKEYQKNRDYAEAEKIYLKCINDYPSSAYSDNAAMSLLWNQKLILKDKKQMIKNSQLILEKTPESKYNKTAIQFMLRSYHADNRLEEGKQYLRNLRDTTSSTKLADEINESLIKYDRFKQKQSN